MSEALDPNEVRNKNKRKQQALDKTNREVVIRELMDTPRGRRFVWLELEAAKVFHQTLEPGSFEITGFNEGKRSVGLRLLADVSRLTPAGYIKMTQENSAVELSFEQGDDNERSSDN